MWQVTVWPQVDPHPRVGWAEPKALPKACGLLQQGPAFTLSCRQLHRQASPLLGQSLLLPGRPLQRLHLPFRLPPCLLQLLLSPIQLSGELAPTQTLSEPLNLLIMQHPKPRPDPALAWQAEDLV